MWTNSDPQFRTPPQSSRGRRRVPMRAGPPWLLFALVIATGVAAQERPADIAAEQVVIALNDQLEVTASLPAPEGRSPAMLILFGGAICAFGVIIWMRAKGSLAMRLRAEEARGLRPEPAIHDEPEGLSLEDALARMRPTKKPELIALPPHVAAILARQAGAAATAAGGVNGAPAAEAVTSGLGGAASGAVGRPTADSAANPRPRPTGINVVIPR